MRTGSTGFRVGDHVSWNSEAGRVSGIIRKKISAPIKFKGYTVHASKEASSPPEWAVRPYDGEVLLPEPVNDSLINATYGSGVLVIEIWPVGVAAEIRLATLEVARGEHIGHVSRLVQPTTAEEHIRNHRGAG